MADNLIFYLILACLAWILLLFRPFSVASKRFIYPPGPRALPLIGNLFDFPTSNWWFKFTELGERFGAMVHLSVANHHVVVMKDQDIVKELLDKTSAADRPRLVMAGELMGFGISIALIGYGERWRTYRRISHQVMSATAVQMYYEMQEKEARRLVHAFVDDPQSYRDQIRFSVGRTIMDAIYGIDCATPDNTYIRVAEATLDNITHAIIPGSFVVDGIPWLKYLPYIGLPFQKHVKAARKQVRLMVQRPFEHVLRNRKNATAKPSFTSSLLDGEIRLTETAERNDIVSWAAATMYGAAGETTHATLLNFILSMTQNPDIQQKAFAEIERVVGRQRCPNFSDRPSLPYVNALIKEVTRWRVALPLGVPHMCREDVQYKEYFLSKGTILIPNVWSISRDPVYYKDPQKFNPERFLQDEPELDPFTFAFGFGPRTCVGKNFATNQLYIFISSLLWAFEIAPVDRNEIPDPTYTSGFVRYFHVRPIFIQELAKYQTSAPMPFECKLTPRHSGVEELTKA